LLMPLINQHYAMKTFLTSALDGDGWLASCLSCCIPGDQHPLDRKLGGPQSQSGRRGEEKNFAPAGNQTPAVQPIARCYTDWATSTAFDVSNTVNTFFWAG
jgi:hypothetical protein